MAAQGFTDPIPRARLIASICIGRLADPVLQLDSVSVAVRAHYVPVFSRLGPYDREVLDRAAWSHSARSPPLLVEYWAHEAALMAVDHWPLFRWRMEDFTHGRGATESTGRTRDCALTSATRLPNSGLRRPGQIEEHLGAEKRGRKGPWWDRSEVKWLTEALFAAGELTTATRVGFTRDYDLTENVVPRVHAREIDETRRSASSRCAPLTALGVGTEADIRDYFRLKPRRVKRHSPSWSPRSARTGARGGLVGLPTWAAGSSRAVTAEPRCSALLIR